MNGWATTTLGDLFEIARGGSPRPIENFITESPQGVNWVSISDATDSSKFISATKRKILPSGVSRSRMVKPGDLLLTNSMSFGRPYIMNTTGCIHDGWLVLSSKHNDTDANYFFHLLGSQSLYAEFERLAAGVTVKNLNIDLVRGVQVSRPPLAEQQRIANILDAADALRAKRRAAIEEVDSLSQAIFIEMFGDPTQENGEWPAKRVEDVAELVTGYPFRSEEYTDDSSAVRLCRGTNVFPGTIDWSDLARYPAAKVAAMSDFNLRAGDVVLAMDRPWVSQGFKIAMVTLEDCPSLLVQRVARIRANDPDVNRFLYFILNHPGFVRHCRPTETTIPHISPKEIRSFRFSFPPLPLQQEFARRIAAVEALKAAHRASLAELDALFASLQHRAFRGEL